MPVIAAIAPSLTAEESHDIPGLIVIVIVIAVAGLIVVAGRWLYSARASRAFF
ncbi:hypothetical protein [Bifidobacterium sp.]|jgi:hypothetical protein|uniref:hypothetical protein n=1 Tax=Bifidobacterium sp. TaxID=41200 RepID=UPI0025C09506|nr:hypothetical protein [Bifidobacterium sp.]MCH4208790.1 hypothetical protein [Bifidobacterium sp.]MCI1224748.1 hypothetical protein [Bifidobacterium sp.]